MTEQYGNPHSRTHLYGWEAEEAVEQARAQVRAPQRLDGTATRAGEVGGG